MDLRYIEYGKIFLNSPKGAREYSPLNRSDNELIKNTKAYYLNEVATFGAESESDNKVNETISFALIPWDKAHFLFIQLQRRREDEFVDKRKYTPETQRPFNQARFTFINKKDFNPKLFRLSQSLFYENPEYPGQKRLLDYKYPCKIEVEKLSVEVKKVAPPNSIQNSEIIAKIIDVLFIKSIPEKVEKDDSKRNIRLLKPVYIKTGASLDDKIFLFDELQYWLYPALGPVTFASDFITNKEVSITLADKSPDRVEKDHSFDGELPVFSDESYFAQVTKLKEEELYSEVFEHYIRTELTPKESVTLFKLIETDQKFSDEEELRIIDSYIKNIRGQDLSKIIQDRFNDYEKLLKLIPVLKTASISKRLIICQKVHVKVDKKLEKYYPFHLAAIGGFSKFSEELYEFRELLRDSVIQSSEKSLEKIPLKEKPSLYEEFILTDCKFNRTSNILEYIPSLYFAKNDADSGSIKRRSILQILVEKHETVFFNAIQLLSNTKIWAELLHQIINIAESKQWNINDIYKLWTIEPQKNTTIFLRLLEIILIDSNQNSNINNDPLVFQKFLEEGRELTLKAAKKDLAEKRFHIPSLINWLNNTDNTQIADKLRNACIQASVPSSNENVTFASWWFLEELLISEDEIFISDYNEIIKIYQPKFLAKNIDFTNKSFYILSGGRLNETSSLVDSLSIKTDSSKTKDENIEYYFKILSFWAKKPLVISKIDIVFLIDTLPDTDAKSILYHIALSANKKQLYEIKELSSDDAIKWLKEFRIFTDSNEDLLLTALLSVKKPTINFARFVLVFDLTSANKFASWKDYSNYKNKIYAEIQKKMPADVFTEYYLHLLSLLDGTYNLSKYHDLLKLISLKYSGIVSLKEAELRETNIKLQVILDFISENQRIDDDVKKTINLILNELHPISNYREIIKTLNDHYLKILHLYTFDHKEKLEIQGIVESEYTKRSRVINSVNLPSSNSSLSMQPRKVLGEPERKEHGKTDLANSQAQISNIELSLYIILGFIVLVIIILSIIGLSDVVFRELWNFFKFIGKK